MIFLTLTHICAATNSFRQITVPEKVKTRIQLKLYIICLKLQEYERKTMGDASNLFKYPDNLTICWYQGQLPMLPQQRMKVARSLSQIETPLSLVQHHSQSLLSLPSRLTKYRSNALGSENAYEKDVDDVSCYKTELGVLLVFLPFLNMLENNICPIRFILKEIHKWYFCTDRHKSRL